MKVQGLGLGVQGVGFRGSGLGFRVDGLGFAVKVGLGVTVKVVADDGGLGARRNRACFRV